MVAFYITLQPNITSISLTEQDIIVFILAHPSFFLVEVFIVSMIAIYLDVLESFLNKVSQRGSST